MTQSPEICVIGAGVIGLSCAFQIQEKYPNVNVTIIADRFSPDTTSDGSAGFWEPYLVGDTDQELVIKWAGSTFRYLLNLTCSKDALEAGVETRCGYEFFETSRADPFWRDMVMGFRHVSQFELDTFAPHAKMGWFFTSVMCGCIQYLPWLEKKIKKRGAVFVKRRINSFAELAGRYDIVMNCSGLGSSDLCNDQTMSPIQGQVIRVKNVATNIFMATYKGNDDDSPYSYIFPWRDTVILGGTAKKGAWDQVPTIKVRNQIMERCCEAVPSLKDATIIKEWTGLRPWRSKGIRLEKEVMHFGPRKVQVVHNYGHSGAGVTLHWGCAEDATDLVGKCLQELHQSKL